MDQHMKSQVSLTSSESGELNKATSSQERQQREFKNFPSQSTSRKCKASNFPVRALKIGFWKRVSKNEGDMVVKIYFARKMMVWEFLEETLKSKIEMRWSDITAITASLDQGQLGRLKIELNQPPQYYKEIPPQPQKHTMWRATTDFTEGQASLFRRYSAIFVAGVLDEHYEKLLKCDSRLFNLSRRPFPTLNNPFFTNSSPNHQHIDVPNSDPQSSGAMVPYSNEIVETRLNVNQRVQNWYQGGVSTPMGEGNHTMMHHGMASHIAIQETTVELDYLINILSDSKIQTERSGEQRILQDVHSRIKEMRRQMNPNNGGHMMNSINHYANGDNGIDHSTFVFPKPITCVPMDVTSNDPNVHLNNPNPHCSTSGQTTNLLPLESNEGSQFYNYPLSMEEDHTNQLYDNTNVEPEIGKKFYNPHW